MAIPNFTTEIVVENTASDVFNAINNVRGWWQGDIEGNTDILHGEFTYRAGDVHFSKQKIVELVPGQKVVWLVTYSEINYVADKSEWEGTKIIFDIAEINNKTQVRFTHVGLVPQFECYDACSNAWSRLMQESLFSLITTGKGTQVFG